MKNILRYWLEGLAALSLGVLTVGVFLQILFRFVIKISSAWTVEIVTLSFVYLVFLGAAIAVKNNSHYSVEIIDSILPEVVIKFLKKIVNIIIIFFLVIFIYYSFEYTMSQMKQLTPALSMPKGYVYIVAPISGVIMIYYQVIALFRKREVTE